MQRTFVVADFGHGKFKPIAYARHCSAILTAQLIDDHDEKKSLLHRFVLLKLSLEDRGAPW